MCIGRVLIFLFAYNLFNHEADVNEEGTQIKRGAIVGMLRECDLDFFFVVIPQSQDLWKKHYVWDLPLQLLSSAISLVLQTV